MPHNSYHQYHHQLILNLTGAIKDSHPFNGGTVSELQDEILKILELLLATTPDDDMNHHGQWLTGKIVSGFPHIMPMVPRDLLWYFGGDCLHFLGDEEIQYFQALEEAFHTTLALTPNDEVDYAQMVKDLNLGKIEHY
ncbi:MAG: hypothetical protein ACI9Y1_000822 [Lentisphaeria bacterium]|jgi:hypothetical protein